MDALGLKILLEEMRADCAVIDDAARKARLRLEESSGGRLEACAYELARLYNTFEKSLERVCTGFESHFEKRGDYHEKLIQRMSLTLPGIRPAFIPADAVPMVRELKGFRHLVRHAYDITFREDRLRELANLAAQLAADLREWMELFSVRVNAEQGWS